jgi:hypothetical protein
VGVGKEEVEDFFNFFFIIYQSRRGGKGKEDEEFGRKKIDQKAWPSNIIL